MLSRSQTELFIHSSKHKTADQPVVYIHLSTEASKRTFFFWKKLRMSLPRVCRCRGGEDQFSLIYSIFFFHSGISMGGKAFFINNQYFSKLKNCEME